MNKNMRISFILDSFGGGGKERRCLQLIQGLNAKGIRDIQFIIVNNDIEYPEIYHTSVSLYVIDRKNKGLSHLNTVKELNRLLNNFKPDIVQVWGLMSAFYVNFLKLKSSFKYFGSYVADCNKPKGINMITNIICFLFADKIIGNSYAGLKAYKIPFSKQVCIYNGYNEKRLRTLSQSDKIKLKETLRISTPYVVTMVARVDKYKDYESFIKFAYNVRKKRNDVTFISLGKGDLLDYFKKVSKDYKECVQFMGFRSDVDEIFEITTVSCLLSNSDVHGEGISNSILESMAHGIPVLASNAGGNPEIIENGKNGFLIDGNNIDELTNKLMYLLNNLDIYIDQSKYAKKSVKDKFNLSTKADEYIALYKGL